VKDDTGVRQDRLWMGLILALALAIRLYHLGQQSFWLDETYSWFRANLSLGESLESVILGPPLYYVFIRPVVLLGQGEFVLRFSSASVGVVGVAITYQLGRLLAGRRTGLLAALLCAVNPFHVWYSQEFRFYALVYLLSGLLLYLFLQLLEGKGNWIAFTVISIVAYLVHYFTLLLTIAQFVYFVLTLRRRYRIFRRWVVAQAIAGLVLGGWVLSAVGRGQVAIGVGWIPRPSVVSPLLTLSNLALLYTGPWMSPMLAGMLLVGACFLLSLQVKHRRLILLLWLFVPVLFSLLISWFLGRNFYVDRYFMPALPAYLLLLARGMLQIRWKWLRAVMIFAMVGLALVRTWHVYFDPKLARHDVRGAVQYVESHLEGEDRLVIVSPETIVQIYYYASDFDALDWTYILGRSEADPWPAITAGADRIWLLVENPNYSNHVPTASTEFDPLQEGEPKVVTWLNDHRGDIVERRGFSGLMVLLVQVSP
jgi:mannosyltransferase